MMIDDMDDELASPSPRPVDIDRVSQFLNQASSDIVLSSSTTMKKRDKHQRFNFDEKTHVSEYRSVQRLIDSSSSTDDSFPEDEAVELILVDETVAEQRDDCDDCDDEDKDGDDDDGKDRIKHQDNGVEIQMKNGRNVLSVDIGNIDSSTEVVEEGSSIVEEEEEEEDPRKGQLGLLSPRSAFRLSSQFKVSFKETSKTSIAVAMIASLVVVPLPHLLTILGFVMLLHDVAFHFRGRHNKLWSHRLFQQLKMYQQTISETSSVDEFRRQHVCWWPDEAREVEDQLERARKMYQFFLEEEQAKQKVAVAKATDELKERIHKLERELSELEAQHRDEKQHYHEEMEHLQLEHRDDEQRWKNEMDDIQHRLAEALDQLELANQQPESTPSDDSDVNDTDLTTRSSFEARLESSESHSRAMQALLLVQEWEQKNERELSKSQRRELEDKVVSYHAQSAKMTRYVTELIKVIELSGMTFSNNSMVNYDVVREAERYVQSVQSKTKSDIVPSTESVIQNEKKATGNELSRDTIESQQASTTSTVANKNLQINTVNGNVLLDLALLLTTGVDAVYFWTMPLVSSVLPTSWLFNTNRGTRK